MLEHSTTTVQVHDRTRYEGPSSLTSVQHLETNRPLFDLQTKCQRLLHQQFDAERLAILTALGADPHARFKKRFDRIQHCCRFPVIYVDGAGKPSMSLARCRDRLCPLCSAARSRESGERVKRIVQQMDAPRFMTLTVRASDDDLDVQLRRLMDDFRELRKEPDWKFFVKGGIWSLELTFNAETQQWHPHIHIIFDGGYFPQPKLKAIWSRIQHQDSIVDVRAVSSVGAAARYIAKYVSKTVELGSWGDGQITEYANAMHRRRTIHTFGSCHGRTAEADPDDEPKHSARRTVGVWVLRRRIALGDEQARRAALVLCSVGGVFRKLLQDSFTHCGWLEGDRLTEGLIETVEWLLELNPDTAATWRPPQPPGPKQRPKPPPDPSFGNPGWIYLDQWDER